MIPIGSSHLAVVTQVISGLVVASFVLAGLSIFGDMERVLDPSSVMNVLVMLENDVKVEFRISHVLFNPPGLKLDFFSILILLALS